MKFFESSTSRELPPVIVDVATPEDAAEIVRIQTETWLATYPNSEYGITVEDIQAKKLDDPLRVLRWQSLLENGDGSYRIWIAKEGARAIGYCFVKKGEKENHVNALYISPQEQHHGIGRKLMDEACAWLGTSRPIVLEVAVYNVKAVAFYEKYGFQKSDVIPEPLPLLPSGKIIPTIRMVKQFEDVLMEDGV